MPKNLIFLNINNPIFQKTEDGEFWLGTDKGIVNFNPRKVKPFSQPPNVFLDQIIINDQDTITGYGIRKSLELPYDSNTLSFNILPITFYKAKTSKVKFKLENYDDKWIVQNHDQKVRYTKIPFGNYTLKYQAVDTNGNESEIKLLAIKIHPPFYLSWWFFLLTFLLTLALVYLLYTIRINQIKKKERAKTMLAKLEFQLVDQELKALRAQMNPHFLFNAMNSIKGIIIKKEIKNATEYLTKFSSLIRSILENSEKKLIPLSKELQALKLYIELESLRFNNDFNYQLTLDKNIDPNFVRILPLVFQPFVENAIWHGLLPKENGNKELKIFLSKRGDYLICEIEDNGIGRSNSAKVIARKNHQSMGTDITIKRIKMHHSANDIQILDLMNNSNYPIGTKVILTFYIPE